MAQKSQDLRALISRFPTTGMSTFTPATPERSREAPQTGGLTAWNIHVLLLTQLAVVDHLAIHSKLKHAEKALASDMPPLNPRGLAEHLVVLGLRDLQNDGAVLAGNAKQIPTERRPAPIGSWMRMRWPGFTLLGSCS